MTPEGITRKLIAILSADVKDYTRLMSQDDVGTIRTLTAYKEAMEILIRRYRGQVVDATGDNVLARFDSVLDAVNAAAEIQRDLAERNAELPYDRRMEFRIGISLGDVVEEEARIYGDGVNIAARLHALSEGGGICISSMVHDHVQDKLGFDYEDLGEQTLKNIAKPIRMYRVLSHPGAAAHRVKEAKKALRRKWIPIAFAAGVLLLIAAGLIWRFALLPARSPQVASVQRMAHPLPDKPSIAVLPFEDLGEDKSREFIADGMTEDIISALARFKQLFVIARNSTQTYKGKTVKVQQVAQELGVRYVLEGSVEVSKDRIRVTAQLIDAISGTHLWVEQFDRPLTDVFQVRDEVTRKIVGSLAGKLSQAEMARASLKHPDSLDAYGLVWRAIELGNRFNPADMAKARELCEKAIALDPNYVGAYAQLAFTHIDDFAFFRPARPQESYQKALDMASKAVALDPSHGSARRALGFTLLYGRKHHQALAQYEEGLKANPNDASLLVFSAGVYYWIGQPEEAIKRIKEAMRLNPYHPNWYQGGLAEVQYFARDYEGAIETLRQMSPMGTGRRNLAASLAYLGRMEEAHAEAERFMKENPSFSATDWGSRQPFLHDKDRQHAVEGYIKAGLPR
jgi:TolB-like protein/class 3 adenylate cyclase/cytochrome c-type biogenesis protein CcmH/NrfG